jgi:thymidine phosphorylase
MAGFPQGMTIDQATDLALAKRDFGQVVDWSASRIDGPRLVQYHFSGGLREGRITLVVAPLAAAHGVVQEKSIRSLSVGPPD